MMRAVLVVALSAGVPFVSSLRVVPTRTMDRRSALSLAGAAATFGTLHPLAAHAAGKGKIVVFGGSGYVGAYASQMLVSQGYDVISVSRKSPSDAADKVKAILGTSLKVDYQQLDAGKEDLTAVLKGASGVISCVGVAPGGGPDQKNGNGAVNVAIADASKAAGIERFVYLGLADELANGPVRRAPHGFESGPPPPNDRPARAILHGRSSLSLATTSRAKPSLPPPSPRTTAPLPSSSNPVSSPEDLLERSGRRDLQA